MLDDKSPLKGEHRRFLHPLLSLSVACVPLGGPINWLDLRLCITSLPSPGL